MAKNTTKAIQTSLESQQNPAQTKATLVELEERARRVEDIRGETVDSKHKASVIMGVLDMDTLKAVSQTEGSCKDAE